MNTDSTLKSRTHKYVDLVIDPVLITLFLTKIIASKII